MATKDIIHYSVVRYYPDPIRDERINIGIIIVNEGGEIALAKFSPSPDVGLCFTRIPLTR